MTLIQTVTLVCSLIAGTNRVELDSCVVEDKVVKPRVQIVTKPITTKPITTQSNNNRTINIKAHDNTHITINQ